MQRLVGLHAQFYTNWLKHPDYDDYWKPIDVEEVFEKIPIPGCTFGGWFDILLQGSLHGYEGMSKKGKTALARQKSQMIIGPWGHGVSRKYRDFDFGEQATLIFTQRRCAGTTTGLRASTTASRMNRR